MHFQESSHQIVNLGHAYSHYLFSFNFFSKTNLHNSINNQFFMKKILNFKNKKHNDWDSTFHPLFFYLWGYIRVLYSNIQETHFYKIDVQETNNFNYVGKQILQNNF